MKPNPCLPTPCRALQPTRLFLAPLLALELFTAHTAHADLVQHLDATVVPGVEMGGGGTFVNRWLDQSGNGAHATKNRGSVVFPSTSLAPTGLEGLDFGLTRNDLKLMSPAAADALLNFGAQAAGKPGFSVGLVFKVDQMPGEDQYLIGTKHTLGNFAISLTSAGSMRFQLNNNNTLNGTQPIGVGDTVAVIATYHAATGNYSFWESKNNVTATGNQNKNANYGNSQALTLGEAKPVSNSTNYFRGMIGEVLIYDTNLTASEISQLQLYFTEKWITGTLPPPPPPAPGPGFSNVDRTGSVGTMLCEVRMDPTDNIARTTVMGAANGFLYMTTRGDAGGSFSVWDISDPETPQRLANSNADGEQHTAVTMIPYDDPAGNIYYMNNDDFMNIRDPLNPVPETPSGYLPGNAGPRGLANLPYEFAGGPNIRIRDTRTGTNIATLTQHGFDATPTPLGNLLLVAGIRGQARGFAVYDIADPSNPQMLDMIAPGSSVWHDGNPAYEYAIWKHYLVIPNVLSGSMSDDCAFVDFSDPTALRHVTYINGSGPGVGNGQDPSGLPGKTRYAQFQDNHMFLGSGKYDLSPLDSGNDPTLELVFPEQGQEYLLPLGNLVASAENTEQTGPWGFRIFAHQAEPDTNPPTVAFHNPSNGAMGQHVKSRVGVVIHETLDLHTINSSTFRLYPSSDPSGSSDVQGNYNVHDKDIINFTPEAELAEGTTYTVMIDGISDVSGNLMTPFSFTFTTAGSGGAPPTVIEQITTSAYPVPIGADVTFSAVATGGLGALEYQWDFGDGTPRTEWSTVPNSTHSYGSKGHYNVQVKVRDASGQNPRSGSIVATVTNPVTGPTPLKASQVIVDEINRRVWTVNPDNNTITAIDADSLAKVGEYPTAKDPRSLAQDSNGNLWVACLDDAMIDILDHDTGEYIDGIRFQPGSRPHDIVFNHDRTYAYVSLKGSGHVVRINAFTMESMMLSAGETPTALALTSDSSQLLVNRFISPDSSGEVRSFLNAGDPGFVMDEIIDLQKDTTSPDTGDSGRGLPNYLADVVISPDGQHAFVVSKKDNVDRGTHRSGEPLTFDTTSRTIVSKIEMTTGTERFEERIDIDNSSQPSSLLFSPLGDYLFVAMQGNNEIRVFDAFTEDQIITLPVGLAPQSMTFDPTTKRLFTKNLNDRSITVYDLAENLMFGWGGAPPRTDVATVATEIFTPQELLGKQIFYNASDERMSDEGYMSCALCHQDGDHDGRTWDFTDRGEGLRNTINLRGRAGMGHGKVHWSANFDEIQDFELDIRNRFGGSGFIKDAEGNPLAVNDPLANPNGGRSTDLDALAAYVASLGAESIEQSPHKDIDGTLSATAEAGQLIFSSLSCVSCHDPATGFTDSATDVRHDVGTIKSSSGNRLGGPLDGIDTPTLLGLHASAPYFHDGSAPTLEAVFDPSADPSRSGEVGKEHDLAGTYALNPQEITNLIAYMKELDSGDRTAPSVPTGVTASPGSSSVTLDWADNPEDDVSSYSVYRSETAGDPNPLMLASGLTESEYQDLTAVNGTTYYYTIAAVDGAGNVSHFSVDIPATPVSGPPTFVANPLTGASATEDAPYSDSIAGSASDPEGDPLTFSKVSGPAWLSVAGDGTLGGTPSAGDVGANLFTVQVNANGGSDTATLQITVDAAGPDATVPLVDPTSRLAYAPFDASAADMDGNLSMALAGAASITANTGRFNGSVRLDGSSGLVAIDDHPDLNNGNGPFLRRTIALWFSVDAVNGRQMIYEEGGASRGFNIYLDNDTLHVGGWDKNLDGNDTAIWAGTWRTVNGVTAGQWHHVVLVLDASGNPTAPAAGQFKAYLDGVEFDVGNSLGMQMGNHSDDVGIGSVQGSSLYLNGSAPGLMTGNVDDFAVWNRALSASEIANLAGLP